MAYQDYKVRAIINKQVVSYYQKFRLLKDLDFNSDSPPQIFVGSGLKYPSVNVGIMAPPVPVEDSWVYNSPNYWTEQGYSIKQILELRKNLINSRFRTDVYTRTNRFLDKTKEIGMASKPVDIEVELNKKPFIKDDFDKVNMPTSVNASLKNIKITTNTRILTRVDKVVDDIDLKAADALDYLYKNKFDENFLTQLLSVGVLGLKKNRKLVPTRFSITATDDTIGKHLIKEVKNYQTINNYQLYYGNYLGNHYILMFFPEVWEYELFEGYLPGSVWNFSGKMEFSTDYENYYGRKGYASNTSGGFYATRLSVVEHLKKIKRQASCLAIRFETPEYYAGLGVFVVRNAGRKTLATKPYLFDDKHVMLAFARQIILKKFNYDINNQLKNSKLLNNIKNQIKLSKYF